MPDVIQSPSQHQSHSGIGHDFLHLFQVRLVVAMGTAMLAGRFLGLQRTLDPPGYGILHEDRTFGAETALPKSFRQAERSPLSRAMFAVAVDLYKLADQLDIFLLQLRERFHECHPA